MELSWSDIKTTVRSLLKDTGTTPSWDDDFLLLGAVNLHPDHVRLFKIQSPAEFWLMVRKGTEAFLVEFCLQAIYFLVGLLYAGNHFRQGKIFRLAERRDEKQEQ